MRQAHIVDLDIMFNNEAHRKDMANFNIGSELHVKKASSYQAYGYPNNNAHIIYFKDSRGRVVATINLPEKVAYIQRYDFKQFKVKDKDMTGFRIFHQNHTPLIIGFLKSPFKIVDVTQDPTVQQAPNYNYYQIYPKQLVSLEPDASIQEDEQVEELAEATKVTQSVIKEFKKTTSKEVRKMSHEEKLEKALSEIAPWTPISLFSDNRDIVATVTPKGESALGIEIGKRNPIWLMNNSQVQRLARALAHLAKNPKKLEMVLGKIVHVEDEDDDEEYIFG